MAAVSEDKRPMHVAPLLGGGGTSTSLQTPTVPREVNSHEGTSGASESQITAAEKSNNVQKSDPFHLSSVFRKNCS